MCNIDQINVQGYNRSMRIQFHNLSKSKIHKYFHEETRDTKGFFAYLLKTLLYQV